MSLIQALRSLPRSRGAARPDTGALDAALRSIAEAFPDYSKATAATLGEAVSKLTAAVESWQWHQISLGDVALVLRASLTGDVATNSVVDSFLRKEVQATTSGILLGVVAEVYLAHWQKGERRTSALAALIQERSQHLPVRWNNLFMSLPELLDIQAAPGLISEKMIQQDDPYNWLLGHGVTSPHAGGLMAATHSAWLAKLPPVRSTRQLDHVFAWLRPQNRPAIGNDMAAGAINKLVEPWISDTPPPDFQSVLLERIVGAYGDPRERRNDFWPLVAGHTRDVLNRWLAGKSMDALLEIITRATANHMWHARHHFWKGLYDRGLVQEAWIALSRPAAQIADDMFRKTENKIYTLAGVQVSRERRDTCLLIMRVGQHIVVEGSHDYRVHLFKSTDSRAPVLYQPQYDAEALTFPANDPSARVHDQFGHWMRWVEERVLT
ncbi:EH signature domain-containing protein [Phyllobacterium sophorae]|nr:EH signature domain-containing protein [Phyllobacterium sophorae]